jgi:integrator complex subunit 3
MMIGRDLVRLLQNVAKIPEFEQLWKDMIQSPQSLSPQFAQYGGLLHILKTPTRKRCLISRLTVEMERKIYFLITGVKAGQQKRYLEWFTRQYLSTPESQSIRVDLLRYICDVVHPTNEQLNAGLTPRWSLCAWLLTTCTSNIDFVNLKLALFYDWLFYDAKKGNKLFF